MRRKAPPKWEVQAELIASMIHELVARIEMLEHEVKVLRTPKQAPAPPWEPPPGVSDKDLDAKFKEPHWRTKDDPRTIWKMEPRALGFWERAWLSVKRWWMR